MAESFTAVAPGRICLFGEHQDYLGQPVIAMAIDRVFRIEFTAAPTATAGPFRLHTPDLHGSEGQTLDIHKPHPRSNDDYCWGIARALLDEGFVFPYGGDAVFRSTIPFRAGCSSSSAMSAAWMRLLLEIGEHPERDAYLSDPERVAYLVYKGEKEKFSGAGGMMDQYSCYVGGLLYVYPGGYPGTPATPDRFGVEHLDFVLEHIVLIDSGQPKDTQGVLARASDRARAAVDAARHALPEFDLPTADAAGFPEASGSMPAEARQIVQDHLINRDLCSEGIAVLRSGRLDPARLGAMLNEEHRILSQTVGISTPIIDDLQAACNAAGALGGKINGSGGGGTLFCYAPDPKARENIAEILARQGIRHYAVRKSQGARILRG